MRLNPNIPEDRFPAQRRAIEINLELRRAARAEIFVILADVGLACGQWVRHKVFQLDHAVKSVELIILFCRAEEMAAALAADDGSSSVPGDLQRGMKSKNRL